jgi:hypothetical protein
MNGMFCRMLSTLLPFILSLVEGLRVDFQQNQSFVSFRKCEA